MEKRQRILIITQKIDKNDDVLGFFHRWVEVFDTVFELVTVICLFKGRNELPEDIHVHSLGKETGESRIKYIYRFYKYIIQERNNYDVVLVHMNAEYVLLGGWFWWFMGKKVALWYNHTYGTWRAKLAFRIANIVFHTSAFAFSANTKKSVRMPAGIDTEIFKPIPEIPAVKNSLLYLGRISSVKNVDILVEAVQKITKNNVSTHLDIYGSPDKKDEGYITKLKEMASSELGKHIVEFKGSVPNYQIAPIYNAHEIFINLTPRGNYDKTILEAMACERLVLVSSEAFKESLLPQFIFKERDSDDLAQKLQATFLLTGEQKSKYAKDMREYVIKTHSLQLLAEKLRQKFTV